MSFFDVLRYFRDRWAALAVITGLSVIGATLDAASVVFVVGLADSVSKGSADFARQVGPFAVDASINTLTMLAIGALAGSVAVTLLTNVLRSRLVSKWAMHRRHSLLSAFLAAQWSVQAKDRSGSLQADLGYVNGSSSLISQLTGVFRGLSGVAILVGTALLISPLASIGILVLGAILFVVLRPLNKMLKRRSREATRLNKRVSIDFGELSELAREIRVFGVGSSFEDRLGESIDDLSTVERRVGVVSGSVTPIYQGLALAVIVGALAAASHIGSVDVALLGAVALLVLRSVSYGQQFQSSINGMHGSTPSLEALDAAMERLTAAQETFGDHALADVTDLCLNKVNFSYGGDESALVDVDLELHRGETIGVVGLSGAGKSTLAQLILRLRPPDSGEVLVNGTPIGEFSSSSWAKAVALVPQEPFLMHGSLVDNIGFLREGVSRADVIEAATAAGIHDTIMSLDDGYDTPVGKSLRNLSGGQIQRIGIARALAGKPTMIVLDEPTSALDRHSEAVVQTTLEALRGHALVIIIAHRLTTLSICDRVIVMDGGRIQANGPVDVVVAESPFFKSAAEQLAGSAITTEVHPV